MRRQIRKPMHYYTDCLYDGTITAAYPIRKPLPKRIKEDHIKIDEDGVCDNAWYHDGRSYSDVNVENRFRFQNIMANRLNTRRAIRELVMPDLMEIKNEINALHQQLDQIQSMIKKQKGEIS